LWFLRPGVVPRMVVGWATLRRFGWPCAPDLAFSLRLRQNSSHLPFRSDRLDLGPRQPKGPLAGTIATTEQRKPWSRDSVKNQQQFSRYRHFLSTSIWTEGPGGRIDLENGILGAIHRRVIGKYVAQPAIPSASLPHTAIMRKLMPVCALPQWLNMPIIPQFS